MDNFSFRQLFLHELCDIYNAEHQFIKEIPEIIEACESELLKETLTNHLEESKEHIQRLNKIFVLLDETPTEKECKEMRTILLVTKEWIGKLPKSALRDAAFIQACQKIEHFEIASYGTLYSYANNLELNSVILDLFDDTLEENGNADKRFTEIAEGTFFAAGVNTQALDKARSQ